MKTKSALYNFAALIVAQWLCMQQVFASDYLDGQKLYSEGSYRAAAAKFEAALKANPHDPNTIYCCAASQELSVNSARARQLYEYLCSSFPSSRVAAMARSRLHQLVNAGGSSFNAPPDSRQDTVSYVPLPGSVSSRSGGDAYLRGLPDQVSVPFHRGGNGIGIYVDGTINGALIRFHLDTGSSLTVVSKKSTSGSAIASQPSGEQFAVHGVGSLTRNHACRQMMDLQVGPILRRDFPVTVQDDMPGPAMLGQDFLKDFDLSVDNAAMQVTFRKKTAGRVLSAQHRRIMDIPFTLGPGGHMIVDALVNGKQCQMYFDTGADAICFSQDDFKRLGIPLPGGPPAHASYGVAGATATWDVLLDSLSVGRLQKDHVKVSLLESSNMSKPLLGQAFFGNLDIAIDRGTSLIHLSDPGK